MKRNAASVTLRAILQHGVGGRTITGTNYRIESIKGALLIHDRKNIAHRAGEIVTEEIAEQFVNTYNVLTLAEKS